MSSKKNSFRVAILGVLALATPVAAWGAQASGETAAQAWNSGDYQSSIRIWLEQAKSGDKDALFNLGQVFRLGRGTEANPQAALGMYRKAAEAGHPGAAEQLGLLLYQMPDRRAEALSWLEQAANQGSTGAHYLLGVECASGKNRPRDLALAKLHLQLAADGGVEAARRPLAVVRLEMSPADRNRAIQLATELQLVRD